MSLFQFPENCLSVVLQTYHRSKESLNEDVEQLKAWMKTQPHLPELLDVKSLENFLILNKCSVEKAKKSVDMYYTLRSRIPEFYEDVNPRSGSVKEFLNIIYYLPFPRVTKEMYRVLYSKLRLEKEVGKLTPRDVMVLAFNLQEVRLKEDVMCGDVLVYDLESLPFGYYAKCTPAILSKIHLIFKKVFSIPIKKVLLINSSPHLNTILMVLKTMVKPKIFDRIRVCENTSILNEVLEKEIIPKDYGGDGPSLEELSELWKKKLEQHQERFDVLDKLRVNESLRPEKLENDDVLGFYGNFKKLNVD